MRSISDHPQNSESSQNEPALVRIPQDDDATIITPSSQSIYSSQSEHISGLPIKTRLFEFEITGLIGEGGFGIVYSAYDHSLDRTVAIKEYMPSALASRMGNYTVSIKSSRHVETFQAGLKSFVNEAKLLARFDHPSLVKVFRFWEANNTAYMAMPLYKGITLKRRLKEIQGSPDEAWLLNLLTPLMDALAAIHEESCFHRDIAPDNIMLVEEEKPVLLDFGAARRVISDMTQDLTVILKPGYAPVEQYGDTESMQQGPWTDIYALGAILYFAVTGKPPEPSIARLMNDKMISAKEIGKNRYSENFLNAIDNALKIRPEERPQNIAAFKRLLQSSYCANKVIEEKNEPNAKKSSFNLVNTIFISLILLFIGSGIYFFTQNTLLIGKGTKEPIIAAEKAVDKKADTQSISSNQTKATLEIYSEKVDGTNSISTGNDLSNTTSASEQGTNETNVSAKNDSSFSTQETENREKLSLGKNKKQTKDALVVKTESHLADRQNSANLLKKALNSLKQSEYQEAKGYADQVLVKDPNNAQALAIKKQALQAEKAAFEAIKIE